MIVQSGIHGPPEKLIFDIQFSGNRSEFQMIFEALQSEPFENPKNPGIQPKHVKKLRKSAKIRKSAKLRKTLK